MTRPEQMTPIVSYKFANTNLIKPLICFLTNESPKCHCSRDRDTIQFIVDMLHTITPLHSNYLQYQNRTLFELLV